MLLLILILSNKRLVISADSCTLITGTSFLLISLDAKPGPGWPTEKSGLNRTYILLQLILLVISRRQHSYCHCCFIWWSCI